MEDDKKSPASNITVIEHRGNVANEALHRDNLNRLISADENLKQLVDVLRHNVTDNLNYTNTTEASNDEVKLYVKNMMNNLRKALNRYPDLAELYPKRKAAYESTMNVLKFIVNLTLDNEEIKDTNKDVLEINRKDLVKFVTYSASHKDAFMEVSHLIANSGSKTLETNFSAAYPFPFINFLESDSFKKIQDFAQKVLEQEKGASR